MLLKNVLMINAVSSGITGVLLALKSDIVATLFKTNNAVPFVWVGDFLIVFSLFVFLTAIKKPIHKGWVKLIIGVDISWVLSSIFISAWLFPSISMVGSITILAVAGWVGLMAYLQTKTQHQI
ncbi:MAG: hypothetical protein ACTILG_00220 [Sphingobacterium sp.]